MRNWIGSAVLAAAVLALSSSMPVEANVPPPEPFMLGVSVAPDADGLRITAVATGSHAQGAQLKVGDVIVGVDGHWVKGMTAADKKNAIDSPHMWKTELVVVRDHRDIIAILVRA